MIVNVASKCGLTPQYKELQELYDQYGKGNFVIVAFPANDFMQQEPGSNSDIKEFCSANYNVSFPLMSKVEVTGSNMAPLYKWLTSKNLNGVQDAPVTWNFQKFMISEKGEWLGVVAPKESPTCPKIVNWLKD